MYRVVITSQYEQLWRYNLLAMCAGFDALRERLYVVSGERIYREEINTEIVALPAPPSGFRVGEPFVLLCESAESLHLIIYVVTHTLPSNRDVESSPPFDVRVVIERDGEAVYDEPHEVNQWGGATIDFEFPI